MAAVFKQDVEFLLKELGLRTCAIDAFSEILSIRQSLDPTRKMKSLFMPTHCWEYMIRGEIQQLEQMLMDMLIPNLGMSDFVFIPLRHQTVWHFTLMVLITKERKWHHYNQLTIGDKLNDKCYQDAQNMHKTVTEFLKRNQANERLALTTGVVEKVVKRRGKTIIVREPLKKGEKETYNFLSHAGTEYPLSLSPVCPQQGESLVDCAVAIMYYMQHLAEGWPLKGIFEEGELTMMRAKIISMMLNAPRGRGRK
ncbi:uncharacterized protein [Malus domestica]|uniref:uncharacterized protein n=1 Tax=Malus domestica TaxID=3750 RepID=UPI0039761B2E